MIDLHAHSTKSDGKDTPAELVAHAAAAGVSVLGITDHDTTAGWDQALQAARAHGIGLVPGIEVSTRQLIDSGRRISVHMLAYLPDPNHPQFIGELEKTRSSRINRAKRMVELLSEDYPISWDMVRNELDPGATIGRPAIADALVTMGIVPTRSDAFTSILHNRSKYYVSDHSLDTLEAIALIRQAGGVSVIAHPLIDFPAGASVQDLPEDYFNQLIRAGLDGIEIHHRSVPKMAKSWLSDLAAKHNLIITGSSDYHGLTGKDNRLAENHTSPEMLDRIIDQASGFEAFL